MWQQKRQVIGSGVGGNNRGVNVLEVPVHTYDHQAVINHERSAEVTTGNI